jgi:hypothetical protein
MHRNRRFTMMQTFLLQAAMLVTMVRLRVVDCLLVGLVALITLMSVLGLVVSVALMIEVGRRIVLVLRWVVCVEAVIEWRTIVGVWWRMVVMLSLVHIYAVRVCSWKMRHPLV